MQQVIYLNYEFGIRKNYFLCKSCSGVGKGDSALFEPKHTIHLLLWINALTLLGRPWKLDPSWAEAYRSWAPDLPLAPHLGVLLSAGCSLPKKTPIRKEPTWLSRESVTAPFNTLSLNISVLNMVLFCSLFPSSKSMQIQKVLFTPSYKGNDKINLSSGFKQWSFLITYIYWQTGRCTYSIRRNWTCQRPFFQRKGGGILRDSLRASSVVAETKRSFWGMKFILET